MLDIEQILTDRYPQLFNEPTRLLSRPLIAAFRMLFHEREINQFLETHNDLHGFAFLEQVLDHFSFSYSVSNRDRQNIPASGRVVIVANHPLGALDALALIQLVSEIRTDVKVVANELLTHLKPLSDLFLPVDNLSGASHKEQIKAIQNALTDEQAVIFFPAGEVSRIRPNGVRDGKWNSGFLRFARRTNSPVLPVYIKAHNSSLFYGTSTLYKPLSALLLVQEMFAQRARTISMRIGETIPNESLQRPEFAKRTQVRMIKKHVYRVGRGKSGVFTTEKAIAHPQPRQQIKAELKGAEILGSTRDDKAIYLVDSTLDSAIMKEIGRLRELSFRKVGEGTGNHRDLDSYDRHYRHIVLWDNDKLEIVGAYRIGEVDQIVTSKGLEGLYAQSLFELGKQFRPKLEHALELGRSFVQPSYWGSRALDFLWQGIGAYLRHHPEIQRLYGPVSISQHYPKPARDMLVYYYSLHYGNSGATATPRQPYLLEKSALTECRTIVRGQDANEDFKVMREYLHAFGLSIPTLYKQYTDVYQTGGVEFLAFNVDPDFSNCIDGLVCAELDQLKPSKRKRYIDIN
ncbi:MAG: lysophospholipid acyltransferase family protein [Gammaproteobacteria bacterium]|nr:lysophospholipid acyltransferase family protein [Gammaproteobacteria bacterium]